MQCKVMNETFGSCRPWAYDNLRDNLNILNNFKLNLCSYEKVYKKYSVKTRAQLPQIKRTMVLKSKNAEKSSKKILQKNKNKTLQSNKSSAKTKEMLNDKSIQLEASISETKLLKNVENHKRGQTSMQMMQRQVKQTKEQKQVLTERLNNPNTASKGDIKNRIFLIDFDEQHKQRRLKKRDLHQIIFGEQQKIKKRQLAILR